MSTGMDAFKELVKRSPDTELMAMDELHNVIFWAGAAEKVVKAKIELAQNVESLHPQIGAWNEEATAISEYIFDARGKRGKKAKAELRSPNEEKGTLGSGGGPSKKPPKWKRLGYKTEAEMQDDEFIDSNPKVIKEVKAQAKKAGDFPSITAAKNLKRAKKAEAATEKYKKEVLSQKTENTAQTKGAALTYLSKLREVVLILPAKVPDKGWTEASFSEARSMVEIIQKRLGVWENERISE